MARWQCEVGSILLESLVVVRDLIHGGAKSMYSMAIVLVTMQYGFHTLFQVTR